MITNIKLDKLEDYLRKKRDSAYNLKITTTLESERVTTNIRSSVKNSFFNDCIKRGITESEMARQIITSYYSIIEQQPYLHEKEITEITSYIKDKIRL